MFHLYLILKVQKNYVWLYKRTLVCGTLSSTLAQYKLRSPRILECIYTSSFIYKKDRWNRYVVGYTNIITKKGPDNPKFQLCYQIEYQNFLTETDGTVSPLSPKHSS